MIWLFVLILILCVVSLGKFDDFAANVTIFSYEISVVIAIVLLVILRNETLVTGMLAFALLFETIAYWATKYIKS
jgi:hypothetical protein